MGYFLFAPLYNYTVGPVTSCTQNGICGSTPGTQGTASLVQTGISPEAQFSLSILVLCLVGVAVGATLHSRSGASAWRSLLWIATILLLGFVVLGMLTIGLFIAPAALLALVAACASLRAHRPEMMYDWPRHRAFD